MRSKAHIKGHPIHPILVAFPIAFFTGTLIFDTLALLYPDHNFWLTGHYLEATGLISAVVTAVPGVIDYIYTVPPRSSAKKRANKHALLNVIMLFLFGTAFFSRNEHQENFIVLVELAGVIILCVAGWHGGTLVHRNQIGIDTRYAEAGKWNEAYFNEKTGELEVAKAEDLKTGQMKLLHVGNKRIVLARTEKGYAAFSDHCSHRGGSLAGGILICGTVSCPWHGSQFDTSSGEVKAGPARDKITIYQVSERQGMIFLNL